MVNFLLLIVMPACFAYCASSDLLTMTISNRLCALVLALFPITAFAAGMPAVDIATSFAIGAAVLLLTFGMFAAGWIGGGDAKFAAVAAVWIGTSALLPYFLLTAVVGGGLTLVFIWIKANPMPAMALRYAWYQRLQDHNTGVPYGIALSLAALIVLPDTQVWHLAFVG